MRDMNEQLVNTRGVRRYMIDEVERQTGRRYTRVDKGIARRLNRKLITLCQIIAEEQDTESETIR